LGRFTQHFVDVLDLEQTPLEFFQKLYPNDPLEETHKYLGRFGVSGKMQARKMNELSDGQKSRVVLAKLGRDVPHILLLDEPTNHLDMESIDALAIAVNKYSGGLVLVSHDMRLISQVAKEIWICDNKTIEKYQGDIMNFKMDLRKAQGIGSNVVKLKGDASTKASNKAKKPKEKKPKSKLEVIQPKAAEPKVTTVDEQPPIPPICEEEKIDATLSVSPTNAATTIRDNDNVAEAAPVKKRYIPPHLRKKMEAEQAAEDNS